MTFNAPVFLFLFLPVVLALNFAMPIRVRNGLFLAASLFFYAWGDSGALWVLIASSLGNYGAGLLTARCRGERGRRGVLALAVGANLCVLFFYKYLEFAVMNLGAVGLLNPAAVDFNYWHLPLGISFFTFGAIAYLVDIARGTSQAERNPLDFGLYMATFPKIVAGPIVRYSEMSGELAGRQISLADFSEGVRRFIIGLGKKVLIANTVATAADGIFKAGDGLDMPTAWLGILCYTLQIYFDFSGYSDMAIGLGRMFGFTFGENFNAPYISQSIQEFWRRWHISLSSWFRDYLYIPLGGSRRSPGRTVVNLLIVFLLCGLWHGASWTFIVWGLYHGFFLGLERMGLSRALGRVGQPLRHAYAILVVMVGWVFFRADSLSHALHYLRAMFSFSWGSFEYYRMMYVGNELILVLGVGILASTPILQWGGRMRDRLAERFTGRVQALYALHASLITTVLLILLFIASIMQLSVSTYSPFIYTKF